MSVSLQKANFWKRISAYMFDMLLTVMLSLGIATALSAILKYDNYTAKLENYYVQYEEEYGIDFDITEEDYNALTQEERENYDKANQAFVNDENVNALYNTMFYLALAIVSVSLLIGHLILYFIVPLFFHNGQTLGKKIFGLAVMRTNCVKASNPVLFIRAIVGLYAIETMFPILLLLMVLFGLLGNVGTITIGLLFVLQIIMMSITQTNSAIHDLLTDTVVVDMGSQRIFETEEDLVAYKLEQQKSEAENEENSVQITDARSE